MKFFSIFLVSALSSASLACPREAPKGYSVVANQKERTFQNAAKSAVIVVKCDMKANPNEIAQALAMLGEVHSVRKGLAYVDVKTGALRIYSTLGEKPVQVSVVGKSADALDKAGRDVVDLLKNE